MGNSTLTFVRLKVFDHLSDIQAWQPGRHGGYVVLACATATLTCYNVNIHVCISSQKNSLFRHRYFFQTHPNVQSGPSMMSWVDPHPFNQVDPHPFNRVDSKGVDRLNRWEDVIDGPDRTYVHLYFKYMILFCHYFISQV